MSGGNIPNNLKPIFVAAGAKYGVPANVLAGVAYVESTLGSDRSTSSAGAIGLMQFLPSTARSMGINPLDDRQAIFGAAKLLASNGYAHNPLFALGAYNGGPGNPQYGYANDVMAQAGRLKGQLAGVGGAPAPAPGKMNTSSLSTRPPGAQFATTTQLGFNQKGYQQAQKDFVLGSFVSKASPYDIPVKGEAKFANPLLSSGVLTTTAPNPKDFVTAQNVLQKISGANLMVHPGAVTGKATLDAASAGAGSDAQKLLGMLHQVQGASYSQANHDAIGESAQQVRAQGTDCSGLISWLMGPRGLGLWHSSLATPDIASAPGLQGGRGSVVTVWNNKQAGNAGHVFIQIGNQFFGSEGGVGIHQISAGQAQNYIQHGSDGGTYLPLHPRGA